MFNGGTTPIGSGTWIPSSLAGPKLPFQSNCWTRKVFRSNPLALTFPKMLMLLEGPSRASNSYSIKHRRPGLWRITRIFRTSVLPRCFNQLGQHSSKHRCTCTGSSACARNGIVSSDTTWQGSMTAVLTSFVLLCSGDGAIYHLAESFPDLLHRVILQAARASFGPQIASFRRIVLQLRYGLSQLTDVSRRDQSPAPIQCPGQIGYGAGYNGLSHRHAV